MKAILKLLFFLLFVVVAVIISGLFLPNELKISSSTEVEAKPEIIFPQLSNLQNWEKWSPWIKSDPSVKINYGRTEGKGAGMNWESETLGNCAIEVTLYDSLQSIAANFHFASGTHSTMVWIVEPIGDLSLINWTFNIGELELWERYFALFYKKEIKAVINSGLNDLKATSESLKYSRIGEVEVLDSLGKPTVIMVDSVVEEKVEERLKEMDAYLLRFFERRELQPAGGPFYLLQGKANDTLHKISLGYPLPEKTWVWRTLQYYPINDGKVIAISHYGSDEPVKAHKAIEEYMHKNNLIKNGLPWEIKLYNPETDKDSTLWERKFYYPVKNRGQDSE